MFNISHTSLSTSCVGSMIRKEKTLFIYSAYKVYFSFLNIDNWTQTFHENGDG